jgi:hypothetical protein
VALDAIWLVPERDGQRGQIVLEGTGYGFLGARSGEGQVQHGGPHLRADPLTLVTAPQPRAGVDLTGDPQVAGAGALLPDHDTGLEHGEVQRPVLRCRPTQRRPVVLDRPSGDVSRLLIGPRLGERHDIRVVDAFGGEVGQAGEFFAVGQAEFEPRCGQAQADQRIVINQHGSS